MKARIAIAMMALAGLSVSPVFAQDHNHGDHAAHMTEQAAPAPNNMQLPADAGQNGANMKASEQAWPMTVAFIRKHADSAAAKSQ
jgi:hypothetical protein